MNEKELKAMGFWKSNKIGHKFYIRFLNDIAFYYYPDTGKFEYRLVRKSFTLPITFEKVSMLVKAHEELEKLRMEYKKYV